MENAMQQNQPTREIPMFRQDQALQIQSILNENGVDFQTRTIQLGANIFAGWHAYIFIVPVNQFQRVVDLIKDFFEIHPETNELFTGDCPACGARVENKPRCPECDLNFTSDRSKVMSKHPFFIFLEQNNLI
ncbi:MAG: hypothetical protein KJ645_07600 [Planctomycetes bacterium]|nr:hypothetical protein [Planctomycetota bacterium]